jgi:hypothetical protein
MIASAYTSTEQVIRIALAELVLSQVFSQFFPYLEVVIKDIEEQQRWVPAPISAYAGARSFPIPMVVGNDVPIVLRIIPVTTLVRGRRS